MNIPKDILDWPVDHAARFLWDHVVLTHTFEATTPWDALESGLQDGFKAVVYHITRTAMTTAREYAVTQEIEDLQYRLDEKDDLLREAEYEKESLLAEIAGLKALLGRSEVPVGVFVPSESDPSGW